MRRIISVLALTAVMAMGMAAPAMTRVVRGRDHHAGRRRRDAFDLPPASCEGEEREWQS